MLTAGVIRSKGGAVVGLHIAAPSMDLWRRFDRRHLRFLWRCMDGVQASWR